MTNYTKIIKPILMLVFLLTISIEGFSQCRDLEPNNTTSSAVYLGSGTSYTRSAYILPGDQDYYRVLVGSTTYYIRVKGYNSSTRGGYTLSYRRIGTSLIIETSSCSGSTTDTYLYLHNASGSVIASNDDGGSGRFSKITYALISGGGCADQEPNGSFSSAIYLGSHYVYSRDGNLTSRDTDYYRVSAFGTSFYIKVRGWRPSSTGGYNLIYIRSGSQLIIRTRPCGGSSTETHVTLYNAYRNTLASDYGRFTEIRYNNSTNNRLSNPNEAGEISIEPVSALPAKAFPNPFTESTTIEYTLAEASTVSLTIKDITGKVVERLINGENQEVGTHKALFQAAMHPAGIYFYSLEVNGIRQTGKLILQK